MAETPRQEDKVVPSGSSHHHTLPDQGPPQADSHLALVQKGLHPKRHQRGGPWPWDCARKPRYGCFNFLVLVQEVSVARSPLRGFLKAQGPQLSTSQRQAALAQAVLQWTSGCPSCSGQHPSGQLPGHAIVNRTRNEVTNDDIARRCGFCVSPSISLLDLSFGADCAAEAR